MFDSLLTFNDIHTKLAIVSLSVGSKPPTDCGLSAMKPGWKQQGHLRHTLRVRVRSPGAGVQLSTATVGQTTAYILLTALVVVCFVCVRTMQHLPWRRPVWRAPLQHSQGYHRRRRVCHRCLHLQFHKRSHPRPGLRGSFELGCPGSDRLPCHPAPALGGAKEGEQQHSRPGPHQHPSSRHV